jgi:hypothetical protein
MSLALVIGLGGVFLAIWPWRDFQPETAISTDPVVATVGTRTITLQALERSLALPLYMVDLKRQQLLQQGLQHNIDEELLTAEARKRHLSVSELLEEASQSESIARLANLPGPVKRLTPTRSYTANFGRHCWCHFADRRIFASHCPPWKHPSFRSVRTTIRAWARTMPL